MRVINFLRVCLRGLSSKPVVPKPGGVDFKKKIVYGGDLLVPVSNKSFGSILFEHLTKNDRQDEVMQVCTATRMEMTTRKFLSRSVAFAERLREEGVKKGDFITLVGNNSLNMNTALAGIFFVGAVPVPITNKTDLDAFKVLMKSIKPKVLGCDKNTVFSFRRALLGIYPNESPKVFLLSQSKEEADPDLESFREFIEGKGKDVESFVPDQVDNPADDLALVTKALTDGTSARAVGITHRNLNCVIARYDSMGPEKFKTKVILMVHKVMWMSGFYSFLVACCYGSKLIVMNEFGEEEFLKAIEDYKVTTSFLYTEKLWRVYKHAETDKYDLSSCKYINAVNGILPKALVDGMLEKTGIFLKPAYGISELTGLALDNPNKKKEGSCGKLVRGMYGKVVSSQTNQKVGPNEKGELCFKGLSLSKGYINDPKSTKQLFDKEGFLLSGHYGYYDNDGDFYIIDKIHYFIQYKDYKVSPRELEGIIKTLDSVRDVAVAGIPHPTDGFYPIAFVAPQKGFKVTGDDILRFVNEKVPDHKRLRGGAIFVNKIPRTRDTGLIKRHLLKKILGKYVLRNEVTVKDLPEAPKPSEGEQKKEQ